MVCILYYPSVLADYKEERIETLRLQHLGKSEDFVIYSMILVEAAQHMIVSKHAPKEESLSVQHRQQMICGRYIFFFFFFLRLCQSLALQHVADESRRDSVGCCIYMWLQLMPAPPLYSITRSSRRLVTQPQALLGTAFFHYNL